MACVADRPVASEPLLEHPQQERDLAIDVVVDANLRFAWMQTVESTCVLDEGALPGHGHGQEQRVQA
jgi:hypothetical protein